MKVYFELDQQFNKKRKCKQFVYKIGGEDLEACEVCAPGQHCSGRKGGHRTSAASMLAP